MIEWIDVNSKNIIRIAYNSEVKTMYINFEGSTTDTPYQGVTEETFNAFSNANNIDEYYKKHIKGVYEEIQIDTENTLDCRM